jgi:tetratricopeptide (TPR) repeat protein
LWLAHDVDSQQAEDAFQRVLGEYAERAGSDDVRRARIGMGDVARQRGDLASAEQHYQAAELLGRANHQAANRGHFARTVEDYLRRGEWKAATQLLDQWEWDCPTDRLTGNTTLLRARCLLAEGRRDEASEHARLLVQVNPRSAFTPELLMLIADVELACGRPAGARQQLERILREHPTSSLKAQAAELLAEIGHGDNGSESND